MIYWVISVVGIIFLFMLILPAMDKEMFYIFPHRLKIKEEKVNHDTLPNVDWIKKLKQNKTIYFCISTTSLTGSSTENDQKLKILQDALLNSQKLETPIKWHLKANIRFGFEDGTEFSFLCDISKQYKVIYGEGWASYDLYNLLCKDGKFDWSFFENKADKQSLKN